MPGDNVTLVTSATNDIAYVVIIIQEIGEASTVWYFVVFPAVSREQSVHFDRYCSSS